MARSEKGTHAYVCRPNQALYPIPFHFRDQKGTKILTFFFDKIVQRSISDIKLFLSRFCAVLATIVAEFHGFLETVEHFLKKLTGKKL